MHSYRARKDPGFWTLCQVLFPFSRTPPESFVSGFVPNDLPEFSPLILTPLQRKYDCHSHFNVKETKALRT